MRRDRIIKAVNTLREALQAAQIRELLRMTRTPQQAESVNRTQRILLAYNEFTRHYQQFGDEEKDLMESFGLGPLLDVNFWSGLIDGEQAVNRKLLADVDVGAYNVIFVMPKLRELLTRDTDRGELIITDTQGTDHELKRVRVFVAEQERSLTDPQMLINVIRSVDELYGAMASFHRDRSVGLAIGSMDSGSAKSLDFFGAGAVMEEMNMLLINVWDRIKYSAEESYRFHIETAMMASGFLTRVKEAQAQGLVTDEQMQRNSRLAARAVETLFRSGAYTEDMDQPREVRASEYLAPKSRLIEFRPEETEAEAQRDAAEMALEAEGAAAAR